MSEEIAKSTEEIKVKHDIQEDSDVICDTDTRSPKRSKLASDCVEIETESPRVSDTTNEEIKIIVKNSDKTQDIRIKPGSAITEVSHST